MPLEMYSEDESTLYDFISKLEVVILASLLLGKGQLYMRDIHLC